MPVGRTGTGKSHIAQALGHRACRTGYQVLFSSATHMLKQLRAARADGSHDRRLARFTGVDLLILDDHRLLHDTHVVVFDGDACRNPPPTRKRPSHDERTEVRPTS